MSTKHKPTNPATVLAIIAAAAASAALGVASMTGCAVDEGFVAAVDGYSQAILPEYRAYILADEGLSPETKRIRLQTAERFEALIDTAMESLEAERLAPPADFIGADDIEMIEEGGR